MEEPKTFEIDDSPLKHSELSECRCDECSKVKDHYVRIIDMDRFVDNLNDWD